MATRNRYTPGVTSVDGTAVARPWDYQGQTLLDYYQQRLDENPNFQVPAAYHVRDGKVIAGRAADWADWVEGISKYAALATMGYGAYSLAAPYFAGAAAGGAGTSVGAGTTTAGVTGGTVGAAPSVIAPTVAAHTWLTPAVTQGISVGGNLIAAKMQSNAANDAAAIQSKSAAAALAYEKERDAYARALDASRYGDYAGRIAPYVANGTNAGARMAALLGLKAPPPQTSGPPPPPVTPQSQTVTMRAPDGSTKQVPASEVSHWVSQGATVVSS